MVPFYTQFPDLAFEEMRSITVRGVDDLPDGTYGFLEFYCDETGCDCRRVVINVISPDTGSKVWATINYGWESLDFYERWMGNRENAIECRGPSLDPLNPQTEYSHALVRMFELNLKDKRYVERLKRHYRLFKSAVEKSAVDKKPGARLLRRRKNLSRRGRRRRRT